MKNDLLIKLQHFFTVDMRIKKEMYDMVPPDNESYLDKDSICKYVDNLNDSLIYIFSELKCFCSDIFANAPFVLERILLKLSCDIFSNHFDTIIFLASSPYS